MNDFEIIQKCRRKWCRELGQNTNQPMPSEQALAGRQSRNIAINAALDVVLGEP